MLDFGWKKKAEKLRMTLLTAGHQPAKSLPEGLARILDLFRHTAATGDGSMLQSELEKIPKDADPPLWEPAKIYGWNLQVTMYRQGSSLVAGREGQLWWLLHATRPTEKTPSERDIGFLDKVIEHLGADPKRDLIIGPRSSPEGEPALPFGWWTWLNRQDLFELQVKGTGKTATMRIVPFGTRESDGFTCVDLIKD